MLGLATDTLSMKPTFSAIIQERTKPNFYIFLNKFQSFNKNLAWAYICHIQLWFKFSSKWNHPLHSIWHIYISRMLVDLELRNCLHWNLNFSVIEILMALKLNGKGPYKMNYFPKKFHKKLFRKMSTVWFFWTPFKFLKKLFVK